MKFSPAQSSMLTFAFAVALSITVVLTRMDWSMAAAIMAGAALAGANFSMLAAGLRSLLPATTSANGDDCAEGAGSAPGVSPTAALRLVFLFMGRLVLVAAAFYVSLAVLHLSPLGLLLGVTLHVLSVIGIALVNDRDQTSTSP